jgi:Periplasmic component of the Tol biopolymer transport system
MTHDDGFDRTVSTWLDVQAGRGAPGYLDEILARTTRTRQRPAWSSLERLLPMQTSLHLAPMPRFAWLLVVLALIVALGAAVLVVGSRQRLPAPFGLARNGSVAYGASDGDIYALDPATGTSKALIAGPAKDSDPWFSRDGSRFSFTRQTDTPDRPMIMVANADGSDVRALTEPLVNMGWFEWSPDGSRAVVVSDLQGTPALRIFDVDGTTSPKVVLSGMTAESVSWRPDGKELVFRGVKGGTYGLYAVGIDGTGLRPITPATPNESDAMDPGLSPDGTKIVYAHWETDHGVIHVADVDTGLDRIPAFDGIPADLAPSWSPDGTRLVFQRYFGGYYHLVVAASTGGPVVEIGPAMLQETSGADAQFSPDGSKVVAFYHADDSTWMLDVDGGLGTQVSGKIAQHGTWQRLAP